MQGHPLGRWVGWSAVVMVDDPYERDGRSEEVSGMMGWKRQKQG